MKNLTFNIAYFWRENTFRLFVLIAHRKLTKFIAEPTVELLVGEQSLVVDGQHILQNVGIEFRFRLLGHCDCNFFLFDRSHTEL